MKQFYLYLLMVIGIVFLNGCSKDDDNPVKTETEVVLPKEVYRMQIVEAKFAQELSQEEYDGSLGEVPIKLVRADEHTLFFYISVEIAVGQAVLKIPQLNISHTLEIKNPGLKGSATTVLQPIFEKTTPEYQNISTPDYSEYLTTVNTEFKEYYQNLSQEEKNNMALFYQVNEMLFTNILDPDLQEGKNIKSTMEKVGKFSAATFVFINCSVALSLPGTFVEKALIGVCAVGGAIKALDYGKELVNDINIVEIKDTFLSNPTFVNNKTRMTDLYIEVRSMISADSSSTSTGLTSFFDIYKRLNNAIRKTNNGISFINDHVFFANIPLIPFFEIPTTAESETVALTEETFSYMKFNVADPNVQITEAKFENGAIRMKMNVINPNTVTENNINTQLNYTYQEEFNSVKGSFPIEIKLAEEFKLTGVWHLEIYGNDTSGGFILGQIYEINFNDGSNSIGHTSRIYYDSRWYWDPNSYPNFPGYGWHNVNDPEWDWTQSFDSLNSKLALSLKTNGGMFNEFIYNSQAPDLLLGVQQSNNERFQLVKQ